MDDKKDFEAALKGKKVPLLVLDQKWHRLFAIHGKTDEISATEKELDELLKPEGRIILNCITVQTLMQCLNYMRTKENYSYETIQVQVNHWEQVGPYDMAKAANPIFIVTCIKNK